MTLVSRPSYRHVVPALAESEERYRVCRGLTHYAIFMLNPRGIIITWNRGILELLGYHGQEIVGQSGGIVFNFADRPAGAFKQELASTRRDGESKSEDAPSPSISNPDGTAAVRIARFAWAGNAAGDGYASPTAKRLT